MSIVQEPRVKPKHPEKKKKKNTNLEPQVFSKALTAYIFHIIYMYVFRANRSQTPLLMYIELFWVTMAPWIQKYFSVLPITQLQSSKNYARGVLVSYAS